MEPSPAPKRQRVSRACDQCRAAREKCDGIQPLCFPCASQNRQCSWEEPKKKRGVQTGYIRTLELSLGWIFDKIPGSEEALHGLLTHEGGQGRALLVGRDTSAGNRLHRRWRRSIVHQEIDRVLSGGGGDAPPGRPGRPPQPAPAESSDSDGEPAKTETKEVPTDQIPAATTTTADEGTPRAGPSRGHPHDGAPESCPDTQADPTAPPGPARLVRLPSNCWRLLDVYFSYTHCWFPVLEKALVHKACWSYPVDGLDLTGDRPNPSSFAELWAALALAAYQEEANQRECGQAHAEGEADPEEVYRAARSLIPPETAPHDASHVNAILLLTMIKIGRGELSAAWILAGLAARVALSLGLHLRPAPGASQRHHHSYMACFILDTLLATRLGHPPHLRADDAEPILPADPQDDWEIWTPCSGYGTPRPPGASSRSPAHSVSSFAALHAIHRIHSDLTFGPGPVTHREEPYPARVRRAMGRTQGQQPLASYVTGGGTPPIQVPSAHLLRLAFLSYGSQARAAPEPPPAAAVLQCVEEYILRFGCAVPPLFPAYLDLIAQRYGHDLLGGDLRERWRKVEVGVRAVWTHHEPQSQPHLSQRSTALPYQNPPAGTLLRGTTHPHAMIQQLPTPSSLYADTPTDQTSAVIAGDMYHDPTGPGMLHFPDPSRPRQSIHVMDHIGLPTSGTAGFELSDASPQQYPAHVRPGLGGAAFDYDSILDDIASLGRVDRMGSDSQFMANLGFAPGSDLTELLAQEYTGIP